MIHLDYGKNEAARYQLFRKWKLVNVPKPWQHLSVDDSSDDPCMKAAEGKCMYFVIHEINLYKAMYKSLKDRVTEADQTAICNDQWIGSDDISLT